MLAAEIYAKGLSHLRHGLPLWNPEPANPLDEVLIGDVGYIRNGSFCRLFNATRPQSDPTNAGGVPSNFEVLEVNERSLQRMERLIPSGSVLCSQNVTKTDVAIAGSIESMQAGAGARYRFTCSTEHGALLLLKDHATFQEVHSSNIKFIDYMRANYLHWCRFALQVHDIILQPEELVFVRGWVKTTEWAVAAFVHGGSNEELSFQAQAGSFAQAQFSVTVAQSHSTSVLHRTGPHRSTERIEDSTSLAQSHNAQDQCIFLSYFRLKRSLFRLKVIAAAEPQNDDPAREGGESSLLHLGPGSRMSNVKYDVHPDPENVLAWDPLEDVLDYILENSDDVDVAIASSLSLRELEWPSDNDIKPVLQQLAPSVIVHADQVGILTAEVSDSYSLNSDLPPMEHQMRAAPIPAPQSPWVNPGQPIGWLRGSAERRWVLQQRMYHATSHRNYNVNQPPVKFIVNGVSGLRLSDAYANRMDKLQDAEGTVLAEAGQKVTYRLEFPGYGSFHKSKYAKSAAGKSITRAQMAFHIAEVVVAFMHECQNTRPEPGYWHIGGHDGLQLEKLFLVECLQVTKGSCQVVLEFEYDRPV